VEMRAALDTGPRKGTKYKDPGRATDSLGQSQTQRGAKRLLGHRNIQTTINFYCGLETTQANQEFGKIHSPADQAEDEEA
jgi:hypothetical protein